MGMPLVPLPDQEEKHQSGQGVKIPHAHARRPFPEGPAFDGKHAQGDGHIHVQGPRPECTPSADEIAASTVDQHRKGEQEIECPEHPFESTCVKNIPPQVIREGEEHDVAEAEPRYGQSAQLLPPEADRRCAGRGLFLGHGLKAHARKPGCQWHQIQGIGVVRDGQGLPRKIDFSVANGGHFCRQLLQESHASRAVHARNGPTHPGTAIGQALHLAGLVIRTAQVGPANRIGTGVAVCHRVWASQFGVRFHAECAAEEGKVTTGTPQD